MYRKPMDNRSHFYEIGEIKVPQGLWRNGSASESRSDGWAFESLWPHFSELSLKYCNYNEKIGFTLNICKTHSGALSVLAEGASALLGTLS